MEKKVKIENNVCEISYLPSSFMGNVVVLSDECVVTSSQFYLNAKRMWAALPNECPSCRGISLHNSYKAEEGKHKVTVVESATKA
jgi:hypothetical protein